MKVSEIKAPVSSITGIGPQLTKTLAKINIFTVADLLQYFPRDYEDRTKRVNLREFETAPGHKIHTVAQIIRQEWFGYGNMKTLKLIINDGTATADLICFNRAFLEKSLQPGNYVTVTGQFFIKYNRLQSTAFEVTKMELTSEPNQPLDLLNLKPLNSGVVPVYPLTEGLTQKTLHKAIAQGIQQYVHGIDNELPESLIEKHELYSKQDALRFIHQPQTLAQAVKARKTLAYEELFFFQSIIAERAFKRKGYLGKPTVENKFEIGAEEFTESLSPLQKQFESLLPFPLTED